MGPPFSKFFVTQRPRLLFSQHNFTPRSPFKGVQARDTRRNGSFSGHERKADFGKPQSLSTQRPVVEEAGLGQRKYSVSGCGMVFTWSRPRTEAAGRLPQ